MFKEEISTRCTLSLNIEATKPLELVHLDYLQIEPSKGHIENVLIVTNHFTRYAQAYLSKTQIALATAKLLLRRLPNLVIPVLVVILAQRMVYLLVIPMTPNLKTNNLSCSPNS